MALGQRLFSSLDLDASGGVSIKEFLIGLERMVLEVGAGQGTGAGGRGPGGQKGGKRGGGHSHLKGEGQWGV
jgi:hypothetical protein